MSSLTEAERSLAIGDEETALGALLDAWRATKAPQIAELVDAIGNRLELAIAPASAGKGVQVVRLVGVGKLAIAPAFSGKRDELHGIWMAIARERRPADWPRLVREIVLTADRFGVAVVQALIERAKTIADWPPDPRTTALVVEHLRRPGYESSSSSTYPFWTALCDLLVGHGDPRAVDALAALDISRGLRTYSDRKKATVWFTAQYAATLDRLRALPAATPLDKAQLAACAKLAKAIAKRGPVSEEQIARLTREPPKPKPKAAPRRSAPTPRDDSAMSRHLVAAATAAEAGDDKRVLDELLAAWRASRSVKVAELVDAVTKRLEGHGTALEGGSRAEMQEAWLALAKHKRAVDLPVLAANITNTYGRSTDALARVEALARWPADPRTGSILAKPLGRPYFYASSTKPFWAALVALMVDHGDARTLATLEGLAGTMAKRLKQQYADTSGIARWFEKQIEAGCTELHERPAAADPDPALCARVTAALGSGAADGLLAEIAANPDDDGLRQVLGDVLLQRGDPRGELIALQLSGKHPARVEKLVAKHGRAWLGVLADRVHFESCRFERGFPVELALSMNAREADDLAGDPVWATVKRLYLGDAGRLPETLLRHPAMRVEHLGSLSRKLMRQMLAWPDIPYASLGTTFQHARPDVEQLLEARKKLARLRAIELGDQPWLDWLWSSWLGQQLAEVTIVEVGTWGNLLGRLRDANTPRVVIRDAAGTLEIDPGASGTLIASTKMSSKAMNQLMSAIGPGTLTGLRIARPERKSERALLERHATRIGLALGYDIP